MRAGGPGEPSRRVRVHTPSSQGFGSLVWFLAAAAALGGVYEPPSPGQDPVGWAIVAVSVCLALRAWFLGVTVEGSRVVVRSWLRTRTLDAASVVSVEPVNYDGFWVRGSESGFLRTLRLRTETKTITAWGVLGRHGTVDRGARRLRVRLGLPPRPAAGRHSARATS